MNKEAPPDFDGYDQRACPNCGNEEIHMPLEYTKYVLADCSECKYSFVKHPKHVDKPNLSKTKTIGSVEFYGDDDKHDALEVVLRMDNKRSVANELTIDEAGTYKIIKVKNE